jgi:hypothetical protein
LLAAPGSAPPSSEPAHANNNHSHAHDRHSSAPAHTQHHSHAHQDDHHAHGEAAHEEKGRSLWSALFGGDSSEDEAEEEVQAGAKDDDEEEEDANGVKLIAQHLAKVKLAAEEREHGFRQAQADADKTIKHLRGMLKESLDKSSGLEEHVKALEVQNTKKWMIESRDHWVTMVEQLKAERAKLREENARLVEQLRQLSLGGGAGGGDPDKTQTAQALTMLADERAAFSRREEDLKAQIDKARAEAEHKETSIVALRRKLDFELELKWERSREDEAAAQSERNMLSTFYETAPIP